MAERPGMRDYGNVGPDAKRRLSDDEIRWNAVMVDAEYDAGRKVARARGYAPNSDRRQTSAATDLSNIAANSYSFSWTRPPRASHSVAPVGAFGPLPKSPCSSPMWMAGGRAMGLGGALGNVGKRGAAGHPSAGDPVGSLDSPLPRGPLSAGGAALGSEGGSRSVVVGRRRSVGSRSSIAAAAARWRSRRRVYLCGVRNSDAQRPDSMCGVPCGVP